MSLFRQFALLLSRPDLRHILMCNAATVFNFDWQRWEVGAVSEMIQPDSETKYWEYLDYCLGLNWTGESGKETVATVSELVEDMFAWGNSSWYYTIFWLIIPERCHLARHWRFICADDSLNVDFSTTVLFQSSSLPSTVSHESLEIIISLSHKDHAVSYQGLRNSISSTQLQ